MGTYIYLAFCRITCLRSYLESGKQWKITDKRGCLRRAFPSIDLLSNAKEADLHFYSAQLVCGSNAQRPVTWWAGVGGGGVGGERAVVSPRRSSLPWKGLWPEPGWRSKPLSQLQVARFLSPLATAHPPHSQPPRPPLSPSPGQPPPLKRCPLSPGVAPADAATSGRPPAGSPHPHPRGLPTLLTPSLLVPGDVLSSLNLLSWASLRSITRLLTTWEGPVEPEVSSVCKPLKSGTPKGHHKPKHLYHHPQEKSSPLLHSHQLRQFFLDFNPGEKIW